MEGYPEARAATERRMAEIRQLAGRSHGRAENRDIAAGAPEGQEERTS